MAAERKLLAKEDRRETGEQHFRRKIRHLR